MEEIIARLIAELSKKICERAFSSEWNGLAELALTETTTSISLMNKAVSTANLDDQYNLVLVSCGSCDKTMTGIF